MCFPGFCPGQCTSREAHFTQNTVKHLKLVRLFIVIQSNSLAKLFKEQILWNGMAV